MNQLTNNQIKEVNHLVFLKSLVIGFFGGVIWSTLFSFLYVFKMIDINPMILLQIIFGDRSWLTKWYAYVLLIFVMGVLSIIIAIMYYFIFKKFKSWLVGGGFGLIIWCIFFVLTPFIVNGVSGVSNYNFQTYVVTFCVLILYGIFIGYSISFEYAMKTYRKR